jgi:hypothetical protein
MFMTKKSKICTFLLAGTMVTAGLSSCGGGGSVKRLSANDVLGDIPSLIYQNRQQDSILDAQGKAEAEKAKDFEKLGKLMKKYDAKDKELKAKFEAGVETAKPKLVGKDVPFSVADGLGYEIKSFKIVDVEKGGQVQAEYTLKVTDAVTVSGVFRSLSSGGAVITNFHALNRAGEVIGNDGAGYLDLPKDLKKENLNGTELKGMYYFNITGKKAPQWVDFAKVEFIKK